MDPQAAFARRDEVVFVDVREAYEFDAGHIEGSQHIPIMELPQRFEELPKDRTIVCVCQIGQRSDLTARFLTERGYDAHNLEGGVTMWLEHGFPLIDGSEQEAGEVVDGFARDFDGLLRGREPEG